MCLKPHGTLQRHYSDSNSGTQNMEELVGMDFNENNYNPIPPVSKVALQQGTTRQQIDKVNGQINVIHDDSLELTEFKGRFSPFDLEKLGIKRYVD